MQKILTPAYSENGVIYKWNFHTNPVREYNLSLDGIRVVRQLPGESAATKPDNLSLMAGTHIKKGENGLK